MVPVEPKRLPPRSYATASDLAFPQLVRLPVVLLDFSEETNSDDDIPDLLHDEDISGLEGVPIQDLD